MRDIAITALIFGLLPVVLRRPWIGLLLYTWLSLMTPYRFAYGFAYDFPFVQIVAITTLLSILLNRTQVRYELSPVMALLLVWPAWMCITTIFALEPGHAPTRLEEVMKVFLFVHVSAMLLRTREQIHWMVWAIVVSVGFYGVKGGLFTLLTGGASRVWGPPGKSYLSDNNAIAVAIIMVIPLMYYLRAVATSAWLRHGLLASMLLCGMAVLGTYSRGGLLAVSAMLIYLWLKSSRKVMLLLLLVPLVPVALNLMPERWSDRMDTIAAHEEDGSAMSRINTWKMLFNLANDRPVVGGGFELYSEAASARYSPTPFAVHSAHSIYFQTLGEHGYVGLLIFLSIGVAAWIAARRTIMLAHGRSDLAWAGTLARAVQVSLIGYAVGGTFINIAYWDLIYYEIVIVSLLARMAAASAPSTVAGASTQRSLRASLG